MATIGVVLAIILGFIYNNHAGIRAIADQNRNLTEEVSRQAVINCKEIEGLKQRVRDDAIDRYTKLDQNGKLLGITITPEIRRVARAGLDHTLSQYAEQPCPRPV